VVQQRQGLRLHRARRHVHARISSTIKAEAPQVAKKPNYNFEKRRKELEKKVKREKKQEERKRRKEGSATSEPVESALPTPDEEVSGAPTPVE
jgi:hypothetical protein